MPYGAGTTALEMQGCLRQERYRIRSSVCITCENPAAREYVSYVCLDDEEDAARVNTDPVFRSRISFCSALLCYALLALISIQVPLLLHAAISSTHLTSS